MFEGLQNGFQKTLTFLKGVPRLTESQIDEVLVQIKETFLQADVDYDVTSKFLEVVRSRAIGQKISTSLSPSEEFLKIISQEMLAIFGADAPFDLSGKPPQVVLMAGLQGTGKTTTSAKLALYLKKKLKRSPLLVSVDVTRPAAIEQLERLAKDVHIDFFSSKSMIPLERAKEAMKYAATYGNDTLIVDTAGRLSISEELMQELANLSNELKPKHILYVADAMSGQAGLQVAKGFSQKVGLTGAVLTKTDGDSRGGVAFSLRAALGVPIHFVGIGEKMDGLDSFIPKRWISRILDRGDIEGLLEKTQEVFAGEKPIEKDQAHRMLKGQFTFIDFQQQLKMISKMGSFGGLMGMLPGMGSLASKINQDEVNKKLKKINAMIDSMTLSERTEPGLMDGQRKRRISKGSGTTVEEINQFLREFTEMQRMMKQFSGKGMKGLGQLFRRS